MIKRECLIVLIVLTVAVNAESKGSSAPNKADSIVLDTFSNCSKNNLPCGWKARERSTKMFSVKEKNGNYYFSVDSHDDDNAAGKTVSFSPYDYPYLTWRWRVHSLPAEGSENVKDRDDSGAGVYVIFKGGIIKPIIKYVWSTTLPVTTTTKSPFSGSTRIIVLESGPDKLGKWVDEKVNLVNDFKLLFGKNPPKVIAIGLLTDSNNTHSSASADYDDFISMKNNRPLVMKP